MLSLLGSCGRARCIGLQHLKGIDHWQAVSLCVLVTVDVCRLWCWGNRFDAVATTRFNRTGTDVRRCDGPPYFVSGHRADVFTNVMIEVLKQGQLT